MGEASLIGYGSVGVKDPLLDGSDLTVYRSVADFWHTASHIFHILLGLSTCLHLFESPDHCAFPSGVRSMVIAENRDMKKSPLNPGRLSGVCYRLRSTALSSRLGGHHGSANARFSASKPRTDINTTRPETDPAPPGTFIFLVHDVVRLGCLCHHCRILL
jgi:hypothetical protein